jgi:hypothetical protein
VTKDWDEQEQRILAVIGDEDADFFDALARWNEFLSSSLKLPCEVTGIEDFGWEEFYILGSGDKAEYERLQRSRPSYQDIFELTSIGVDPESEWCLVHEELKAHVLRKADRKRFILGLSELKATEKGSRNYQLLHDYSVWLVNYR